MHPLILMLALLIGAVLSYTAARGLSRIQLYLDYSAVHADVITSVSTYVGARCRALTPGTVIGFDRGNCTGPGKAGNLACLPDTDPAWLDPDTGLFGHDLSVEFPPRRAARIVLTPAADNDAAFAGYLARRHHWRYEPATGIIVRPLDDALYQIDEPALTLLLVAGALDRNCARNPIPAATSPADAALITWPTAVPGYLNDDNLDLCDPMADDPHRNPLPGSCR